MVALIDTQKLANNAALIRFAGGILRWLAPVLTLGRTVIVTRHADAVDVLERDQDFTIAEVNGATMTRLNGPFILGMDRSEAYLRERAILGRCVHQDDADRIRQLVRANAAELLVAARPSGSLDVVQGFARPAATRLVADYIGVPGPDEATMMRWMRILFWEAFLNSAADPEVRRRADGASGEFQAYANALIAERRVEVDAGKDVPDDMLTRLLLVDRDEATRLGDDGIRRNLGGVVVGAVDTTSKAIANLVDELLRRPKELAAAQAAARAGDVELVGRYAFEALRFNPVAPVMVRHVRRATVVGTGRRRKKKLRGGGSILIGALPAMFDSAVFENPRSFRVDRPVVGDLIFGHGMHACYGMHVNRIQIPELTAALLRCDLRRAPGGKGKVLYEGQFPDRLLVDLGGRS